MSRLRLACLTAGALVAIGMGADTAQAQYGSSFYYRNPRTGYTYAQSSFYGRGFYSSSFSYGTPNRWYGPSYGPPRPRGGHCH